VSWSSLCTHSTAQHITAQHIISHHSTSHHSTAHIYTATCRRTLVIHTGYNMENGAVMGKQPLPYRYYVAVSFIGRFQCFQDEHPRPFPWRQQNGTTLQQQYSHVSTEAEQECRIANDESTQLHVPITKPFLSSPHRRETRLSAGRNFSTARILLNPATVRGL
jgi:hypothetical protein